MLLQIRSSLYVLLSTFMLLGSGAVHAQIPASTDQGCDGVDTRLQDERRAGEAADIEEMAQKYVTACRTSRTKPELSMAMGDFAAVRRSANRYQESLKIAMECIKFEYLALGCHIEKALSLNGLGLRSEAKEVLKTASNVLAELKSSGAHEMNQAQDLRARVKADDYEFRVRKARAKLWMANQGEPYLLSITKSFQ